MTEKEEPLATRNPTGTGKNAVKVGGAIGAIGVAVTYIWPGIEAMEQQMITAAMVTLAGALGKEVRNYQHTFTEGQKRDGEVQNGFSEAVFNLLGNVL